MDWTSAKFAFHFEAMQTDSMSTQSQYKQSKLLPPLIILFTTVFVGSTPQGAQGQTLDQSATYVSEVDQALTIRKIAVLPIIDNVDGIYSRPIETQLISLVRESHRWDYVESRIVGGIPTASELEEKPSELQRITASIEADAFITGSASRGPKGLSIVLSLFLKNDGKLLAQEFLRDHPRFELADLKSQINSLYKKLISKIPYEGLVLSRQQNRVTINLGRSDGLIKDQVITAIQIIGINRHPKFNFLISSEKEILGRIKVLKVDETLSFGAIVSEKEKGAIQKLAKISGLDQVTYQAPDSIESGTGESDISERADAPITFGKDPKEWVPVRPPSFGQVGFKIGLGTYSTSLVLDSSGTLNGASQLYPSLAINGELWLNPNWTVKAELAQGVISTTNPLAGSTPTNLNHSLTKYSLAIGYNFLIRDDFFGPKMQVSVGFGSSRIFVDDSQPRSLTTTTYSGPLIGLGGSFPVTDRKIWFVGGALNLYVMPALNESPVTSSRSSTNTINDFSFFVERKIAENLKASGSLDFALYSSSLSGSGSRGENGTSLSQRHTNITGGIVYMF